MTRHRQRFHFLNHGSHRILELSSAYVSQFGVHSRMLAWNSLLDLGWHDAALMGLTDKWLVLAGREAAAEKELAQAERELGVQFPDDYRAVMLRCDGGDAGFGEFWVVLWPTRDLAERNRSLKSAQFAPGFTYFGSDGAGEGYAWDWRGERQARYVVLPFVSPEADAAIPSGNTFEEFLAVLHGGIPFAGRRHSVKS